MVIFLFVALASGVELPSIGLSELRSASSEPTVAEKIRDAGGKLGAFVVSGLGQEYSEALDTFRRTLGECYAERGDLPEIRSNFLL